MAADLVGGALRLVPRTGETLGDAVAWEEVGGVRVVDADGARSGGMQEPVATGVVVAAVEGRPRLTSRDGEQFTLYLYDAGLQGVVVERSNAEGVGAPATERVHELAKVMVASGSARDKRLTRGVATAPMGLDLEIVADREPSALREGRPVGFTLLHRGRAVAGREVVLRWLEGVYERRVRAETDRRGRVWFDAPDADWFVVQAVVMTRGDGADWESWWSALTVQRP